MTGACDGACERASARAVRKTHRARLCRVIWIAFLTAVAVAAAARPATAPPAVRQPAVASAKPAAADTSTGRYPSEEGVQHYLSARLLEQDGQLAQALGEYYRALSLDARSADLLLHISQLCAHLGDP